MSGNPGSFKSQASNQISYIIYEFDTKVRFVCTMYGLLCRYMAIYILYSIWAADTYIHYIIYT